jgi:hypothetical protein
LHLESSHLQIAPETRQRAVKASDADVRKNVEAAYACPGVRRVASEIETQDR